MTVIIKCPHCGRMESWREADGARTHCSFCKQPISGSAQINEAAQSHPDRPRTSDVLRHTLWGGTIGGGAALGITAIYHAGPLLLAVGLLLGGQLQDDHRAGVQEYAASMGLGFLIATVVGGTLGSLLMSVAGAALHARPHLLRAAAVGAIAGAILPPAIVLIGLTLPAIIANGLDAPGMPTTFMRHWLLSLALAVVGAVLGLTACLALAAVRDSEPDRA